MWVTVQLNVNSVSLNVSFLAQCKLQYNSMHVLTSTVSYSTMHWKLLAHKDHHWILLVGNEVHYLVLSAEGY